MMDEVNTKEHLEKERKKLAALMLEQERVAVEIAKTKRRMAAWAELGEENDVALPPLDLDLGGLTEACMTVLRGSRKEWLNTGEIQRALKELGFPIDTYKAPNASIATTVNRMAEDGVVVADKRLGAGAIEYKWVGKVPTLADYTTAGQMVRELTDAKAKSAREKAEEQRKKMFPQQLGHPDPLNQHGKK
jgi:hypothetical protein